MPNHAELARYAVRAYDYCNICWKLGVEVNVEVTDGVGIVAIPGTEFSASDLGRNVVSAFPWRSKLIGKAPYGFLRGAQRIVAAIIEQDLLKDAHSIYVTGHSLGAAEAILASELLWRWDFPVRECVALAAPRTGKRELKVQTTIYDHAGDPVLDVPWFWAHPVTPVVLPDVSEGILQHSSAYYMQALELRDG